ncbi:SDR family NAD(P)-dependent oxidoreductase [Streptomyces sasae]|uniref:SDR family NAD(P)-dependent oxidoreductase n=1 Tax=Streptomyces sasae TaxID=1266772 RepID=UPI00292FDDBB|nr:SDR family NAD(P)-dependent oxidoreductase [Streptomyces sasae]
MYFGGPHQIPIRSVPLPTTPTYNATKAALHSFSESLRVQLAGADAGVQVIGVAPPGVRTTLLGQQDDESSMPLTTTSPRPSTCCATNPTRRNSSSSAPGSYATRRTRRSSAEASWASTW